jgi:hypothetical protein
MIDIDNSVGQKKLINQYRLKSIATAIKALNTYKSHKITLEDLPVLIKLPGIGKGTIRRIEELIKTGKLAEIKITKLEESQLKLLDDLEEIYGVGRTTAYRLFKEYKIKDIADLKKRIANKEIEVSENIIKGLKYIDNLDTNIPRTDIEAIHEFLLNVLLELDPKLFGTICGSFRRLKPTSGDVDFIFIHEDYEKKDSKLTLNLYFLNNTDSKGHISTIFKFPFSSIVCVNTFPDFSASFIFSSIALRLVSFTLRSNSSFAFVSFLIFSWCSCLIFFLWCSKNVGSVMILLRIK